MVDKQSLLMRKSGKNLTETVEDALRQRILNGVLKPGDKLPTEQKLTQEFQVSRTVIREAVSGLKADGLLKSRQGAGVFVCKPVPQDDAMTFLSQNPQTIASVIEALELRASVEVGAAELAAQRCSPAQEANIFQCFKGFSDCVAAGEISEVADFAFHIAIAEAANNQKFADFLHLMGRNIIPRSELREKASLKLDPEVEQSILEEHRLLLEAIVARDPDAAGQAMRKHLNAGLSRYRSLARQV